MDLRDAWPAALRAHGFDASRPTAWTAEGLLGYLPPEAQDRLLDDITTLSAPGSRLCTEAVPNITGVNLDRAREMMQGTAQTWRALGLDLDFGALSYDGERNDVVAYLDDRGWQSTSTALTELFDEYGFDDADTKQGFMLVAETRHITSIFSESTPHTTTPTD